MKYVRIMILLCAHWSTTFLHAQTPVDDNNWMLDNTFTDEFNGNRKALWRDLNTSSQWGQELFRSQNISYGTEASRQFLRLTAERATDGNYYSGGLTTGFEEGHLGLGYGYYEIEAKITDAQHPQSGLWPAFWTIHSWKPISAPPYWYEELDIFEPNYCQLKNQEHVVGYWHEIDPTNPNGQNNRAKEEGIATNIDMTTWHKYAVEWIPGKVTFYVDDVPFYTLLASKGDPVPTRENTNLYLDLQINDGGCGPSGNSPVDLGYMDINYFRYYTLDCSNQEITEPQGDGYNFNSYVHDIKKSCIFKNTAPASTSNITIRAADFVTLKNSFTVPTGATFSIIPTPCY